MTASVAISVLLVHPSLLFADMGVVSVERALTRAAQAMSWPLKASPRVANVMVYLRAKGMTEESFREGLAVALDGHWVMDGGKYMITRRPLEDPLLATRRLRIDRFFASPKPSAAGLSEEEARRRALNLKRHFEDPSQVPAKEWSQMASADPMGRFVNRLLRLIGKQAVASLPLDGRVVFSTSPTPRQRAVPPGGEEALRGFVRDVELAVRASQEAEGPDKGKVFQGDALSYGGMPKAPVSADLAITASGDSLSLDLRINGADGKVWRMKSDFPEGDLQVVEDPLVPSGNPLRLPVTPLQLSPEWWHNARNYIPFGAGAKSLSKDLTAAVLDPAKRDWLDVLWGEPLGKLSDHFGAGLIACVPDRSVLDHRTELSLRDVSLVLAGFPNPQGKVRWAEVEGAKVLVNSSGLALTGNRADRAALARLAEGLIGERRLFDVLLDFAVTNPNSTTVGIAETLFRRENLRWLPNLDQESLALLNLFGMLTPHAKREAEEGGVSLPVLSAGSQTRAVERLIFEVDGAISKEVEEGVSSPDVLVRPASDFEDPFLNSAVRRWSSFSSPDPTRVFPRGVPLESILRIRLTRAPAWLTVPIGEPLAFPPSAISVAQVARERVRLEGSGEEAPPVLGALGEVAVLEVQVVLGKGLAAAGSLVIHDVRSSDVTDFSKAPPPGWEAALSRELIKARQAPRRATKTSPPPPYQ